MFAEDLDDSATAVSVILCMLKVASAQVLVFEERGKMVRLEFVGTHHAEAVLVEFGNVGEEPAQGIHDGRKGCRLDVHGLRLPVWQLDVLATSVRFARAPHPQQLILRQDARDIVCELQRGMAELRDGTLLIAMVWLLEPSLRIVAAEPCFEDGRMLVALGDGYLVREEAILERLVVKLRRQTPAFGTNEDDQRPTSFRARPSIASFLLDCKDLGVGPDVARVSFER